MVKLSSGNPRMSGHASLLASGPLPAITKWLYRTAGWKAEGTLPATRKFVLIAAPHTTNWDFPVFLGAALCLGIPPNWMGKSGLFKPPFGGLMRGLGGVPVDRSKSSNLVDQMVAAFKSADQMILTIPPEGTRSRTTNWKSGFWHIARGAKVPIVCGFADYKRKAAGVGPVIEPTDDFEADMARIMSFYRDITGKFPDQFALHEAKPQV